MEPFQLLLWYLGMWFWCPPAFWLRQNILTDSVKFWSAGCTMRVVGIGFRSTLIELSKGWGCMWGRKSYANALSFGMRKHVIWKARSLPPQFSWRPFGGIVSRWCFQRFFCCFSHIFHWYLGKRSSIWGAYFSHMPGWFNHQRYGTGWIPWIRILENRCAWSDEVFRCHAPLGLVWHAALEQHRLSFGGGRVVVVCHWWWARCSIVTCNEQSSQVPPVYENCSQELVGKDSQPGRGAEGMPGDDPRFCPAKWVDAGEGGIFVYLVLVGLGMWHVSPRFTNTWSFFGGGLMA